MSDCNNFWCTYYSDNKSSKDNFIFPTASCLCNYRTLENTEHENSHISQYAARYFARNKNWITFFTPTFLQLFGCSKCRPCARTYARFKPLSSLVDSRVNNVLLQIIPDMNESLLQLIHVIQTHSQSHCCMIPCYISYSQLR